ncbi:hypothetical protein HELRODRAFT_182863 [Helobdella robusta]|uniref:Uncharacterized protein n=1 Tax=Helobdella robusta TaxID=6412 RepID=T1FIW1_HELRO|nr:hypothetical protein HELRODRAFT_182863 [Helobdella robusta]ESN90071.1 hypothetical protein HELRODRAFT_182863 [Helobdella robusta]
MVKTFGLDVTVAGIKRKEILVCYMYCVSGAGILAQMMINPNYIMFANSRYPTTLCCRPTFNTATHTECLAFYKTMPRISAIKSLAFYQNMSNDKNVGRKMIFQSYEDYNVNFGIQFVSNRNDATAETPDCFYDATSRAKSDA